MTKDEAIIQLHCIVVDTEWLSPYMVEAIDMAIEALQRTSNAHPTHECVEPTHECVDLISRRAALDALEWKWAGKAAIDAIKNLPSAQPEQHEIIFQEIVVEYPSISTYPEYEGKPYFSIKYVEDGRGYIGYGTYNPEVLSEYMKEYFIPSEPVINSDTLRPKGKWEEKEVFDGDRTIEQYQSARCSVCGKYHTTPYMYYFNNFNYCPECGADMSGGQE